jgi:N-acylneuraminate cytidylyltransferase
MKQISALAVIPARGGSKGIPGKNIRYIAGKPLISHTIEQAQNAKHVGRVIVSTDSDEIALVSRKYGAEVIERPAEISGDKSPSEAALLHVLDELKNNAKYEPELVVFLQPTSPYRGPEDIDNAILTLIDNNADSCLSAVAEHFTGRWRIGKDGIAEPVNFKLNHRPMRQDYHIEYLENGSIYVFKPWVLRKHKTRLGGKIVIYPMDWLESLQIDSPEDLELLGKVIRIYKSQSYSKTELAVFSQINLLVIDFDGVMTDNKTLVDQDGHESVFCNRGDGLGVSLLKKAGIKLLVLSTETNPVVSARCRKLQIDCIQSSEDKLSVLKEVAAKHSLDYRNVAFIGNDINDIECMKWVGVAIAPSDSVPLILEIANFVTPQRGGSGVVRQVADWILMAREEQTLP